MEARPTTVFTSDLGTLLQDTPVCTKSAAAFLASENGFSGRLAKGSTEAALADRIFDAMEREQLGYEWTTVGLLWQLLGCLLGMHSDIKPPQSRQQITRMKNVLTYIRNNYGEPITLDELAAVAGPGIFVVLLQRSPAGPPLRT